MRQETAFRFIPELIGDFSQTMELSNNPQLMYVDTAVNTLHMASNVFNLVSEHNNTKRKRELLKKLQAKYGEIEKTRIDHFVQETIQEVDIEYEKTRTKIKQGKFRDKEVSACIRRLKENLYKMLDIFNEIQKDPDDPNRQQIEEVTRRAFRDYNNLINNYIVEEE